MSDIEVMIVAEEEKVYIEIGSFINFLRNPSIKKENDELYNAALASIADYLEEKQQEFMAEHILQSEAQDVKEKDRLN